MKKLLFGIIGLTGMAIVGMASAAEPTEEQMKEAILQAMQNEGGVRSNNSVSVNNPLSGASVTINSFKKLGCEKAMSKPGYNCDYEVSAGINFHSNEGSAAGDNHAAGVNALFGMFLPKDRISTGTKRFVQYDSQWRALEN
ncbi:hypothetical protein [Nitrosomonas ureae]|uniref:Uncharacterized protein n=1 Tax=Nitrosomonas ureae TaxID=44577 RepID=A0A1H9GPW5_9PROT|nr:hypothetical protein [Nitrosomonas ureae]PXX13934.1 hypothetical protein C8R27_1183 [Nitrosomonas ureae]SEQ52008.1 hypothetical protein SAMN05421510_10717 [Nitrosomonas ureae]